MTRHFAMTLVTVAAITLTANQAFAVDVDLRDHPVAQRIREVLKPLAQGNRGDAGIDELKLRIPSGEIFGKVWIRNRHNTGRPFNITVYDRTIRGEFRVNSRGEAKGYLDLGHGIRISLREITLILAGRR